MATWLDGDLLQPVGLRDALARSCRITAPRRWVPGSPSAQRFARSAGFDAHFAGLGRGPRAEANEILRALLPPPALADFQQEVLLAAEERLQTHPQARTVLSLPTGAGKTRVGMELARRFLLSQPQPRCVLWLAHTAELLDQAGETAGAIWHAAADERPAKLQRRHGAWTSAGSGREDGDPAHRLLVCTPQKLANELERLGARDPCPLDDLALIIIDEAHRAAAPQYRRLLDALAARDIRPRVVGLTATPFRQEYVRHAPELGTRQLLALFQSVVEAANTLGADPRERLQALGYLAQADEHRIETGRKLTLDDLLAHLPVADDFDAVERIDRRLMELADDRVRRQLVFDHLLPLAQPREHSVLYFGPGVADAEAMAMALRHHGVPAAAVSGETPPSRRRKLIEAFRRGSLRVLCNCDVLTTGFDAPRVSHVVIARPTISQVLFEQMVGRGLRGPRFGGSQRCQIHHFVDDLGLRAPRLGYRAWRRIWRLPELEDPGQQQPPIFSAGTTGNELDGDAI